MNKKAEADMTPTVVNVRDGYANDRNDATTIVVDRRSNWGNPFCMHGKSDQERTRVCDLFDQYARWRLTIEPTWLLPLRGMTLACHCAPKRCHADTLVRLANQEAPRCPTP